MFTRSEKLLFTARRLSSPNLSEEEKQTIARKVLSTELIWMRRDIKSVINIADGLYRDRTNLIRSIPSYAELELQQEAGKCLESIDRAIHDYKSLMVIYGERVLLVLEWLEKSGATVHDLAQIAGCNTRKAERAYSELMDYRVRKGKGEEHSMFVDLIFVSNIEMPVMRKEPDSISRYDWNMPLNTAILEHMFLSIDNNPWFKQVTDETLFKCFPELMDCMVTQQPDGTLEKFYPKPVLLQ